MGMVDYVDFETDCPNCGARVRKFQTKDRICDGIPGKRVGLGDVDHFCAICAVCNIVIDFFRRIERRPVIEDFDCYICPLGANERPRLVVIPPVEPREDDQ